MQSAEALPAEQVFSRKKTHLRLILISLILLLFNALFWWKFIEPNQGEELPLKLTMHALMYYIISLFPAMAVALLPWKGFSWKLKFFRASLIVFITIQSMLFCIYGGIGIAQWAFDVDPSEHYEGGGWDWDD